MSDSDSNEVSPLINKLSVNTKDASRQKKPKNISRKYLTDGSSEQQRDPYLVHKNNITHASSAEDIRNVVQYNRYRYYTKLSGGQSSGGFKIPDHVLPRMVFWPHQGASGSKQSSWITIFAIWNTMMGTSLLSLPWAIQQSGFFLGIGIIVLMGVICLFTCLVIVESANTMSNPEGIEFIDICEKYLGKSGKIFAFVFGALAFLGAVLVYWVLMSNFLYRVGKFAHDQTLPEPSYNTSSSHEHALSHGVYCLSQEQHLNKTNSPDIGPSSSDSFYTYWDQQKTVPFFLIILLLPLSSFKSPTFFTKFNALGTLSVLYIVCFVIVKSIKWGPHLHFTQPDDPKEPITKAYNIGGCPSLTGILALALYIHNAILSILATNEKPENNKRDVSIAYILTASTYFLVAVLFYSCFPLDKDCIEQVFLDNFASSDVMTVVAQCGLLFQMTTVFPLLLYILRVQIYGFVINKTDVGYLQIILMNAAVIACGVLMAVFYPQVGHIIRYVGSVSGLVYIYTLPSLVQMTIYSKENKLTIPRIIFYSFLILLGILNLVAQFLVKE